MTEHKSLTGKSEMHRKY